jgi:hypothetical protein
MSDDDPTTTPPTPPTTLVLAQPAPAAPVRRRGSGLLIVLVLAALALLGLLLFGRRKGKASKDADSKDADSKDADSKARDCNTSPGPRWYWVTAGPMGYTLTGVAPIDEGILFRTSDRSWTWATLSDEDTAPVIAEFLDWLCAQPRGSVVAIDHTNAPAVAIYGLIETANEYFSGVERTPQHQVTQGHVKFRLYSESAPEPVPYQREQWMQ